MYKVTELVFSEKDLFGKYRMFKKFAITDYYNNIKSNSPVFFKKEDATKYLNELEIVTTSIDSVVIEQKIVIEQPVTTEVTTTVDEPIVTDIDEDASITEEDGEQITEEVDDKPKRVKKTK